MKRENLWTNGILIDLDIYWWKGYLQLEANDIDKTDKDIPDVFRLGQKRILKPDVFSPFSRIESQARIELIKHSYNFITDKIRFVPFNQLENIISLFNTLKEEFDLEVDYFIATYPINKINFLNTYPNIADKIQHKYPSNDNIRSRFKFSWNLIEMTLPRDIKSSLIEENESKILKEEWEKSKVSINEQLDEWTKSVVYQMNREILIVCNNLKKNIEEGKVVRPSTLEKAKESLQRIKSLNFLEDENVSRQVENVILGLPKPDDRDIPSVINAFRQTLDTVTSELKLDSTSTGNLKRSFKLD